MESEKRTAEIAAEYPVQYRFMIQSCLEDTETEFKMFLLSMIM